MFDICYYQSEKIHAAFVHISDEKLERYTLAKHKCACAQLGQL